MFCAGDVKGEKDLCPGDQGAPAVFENKLVGIYSWGCSCGLAAPKPSSPVFDSIPFFHDWIRSNIIHSKRFIGETREETFLLDELSYVHMFE